MCKSQAHQRKIILVIFQLFAFTNHVTSQSEVFTMSPMPVQVTNQDDSLQTIMQSFSQLQNWTGDPCVPKNTSWKWLGCNTDNPPRVTSIQLSGYGLEGPIPNFGQMQSLEIIYMDHNHLTGKIPDFLGNLPNLKLLNLSYNNLDNNVPSSLNNSVTLHDVTSNQNYDDGTYTYSYTEKRTVDPLNALWSLLGLVIIVFGIWWCCCRVHTTAIAVDPPRNVVTTVEHMSTETVVVQPMPPPPPVVAVGYVEHTTVRMV